MSRKLVIIMLVTICTSFLAGYHARDFFKENGSKQTTDKAVELKEKYPFLSKRIFLDNANDIIIDFTKLRQQLRESAGNDKNIGIYFQYLPTGMTIGINDSEVFFAASLLKIPMAMEIQKRIEKGEIDSNEELTIKKENIDPGFGNLWERGIGAKVTIGEAIKLSLTNSDNTAYSLLRERIEDKNLVEVYDYLDIPFDVAGDGAGITSKNYTSILRALYFSAYLNYENSNMILDIMSIPSSNDMLRSSIPNGIKISDKFGFYDLGEQNKHIFSDCGIVYIPNRPYSICVMAKKGEAEAKKKISEISNIVYEYVSSRE